MRRSIVATLAVVALCATFALVGFLVVQGCASAPWLPPP